MAYYSTRYEVTASKPGEQTWLVGFTSRRSKIGLLKLMQKRGEQLIELTGMREGAEDLRFFTHPHIHATVNGWKIGFSGRTENEAA